MVVFRLVSLQNAPREAALNERHAREKANVYDQKAGAKASWNPDKSLVFSESLIEKFGVGQGNLM